MKPVINLPAPYPDENCYSILCRFAVRRGWQSASQACRELLGRNQPLAGYIFKPFRKADIDRWHGGTAASRYGSGHSCYPYFSAFLGPEENRLLGMCRAGSVLTGGQEQGISRKCGITKIRKKNLWYCPECAVQDFRMAGETCWRRTPQMPGVSYCPIHETRLRDSGVSFTDINYRIIPANYAVSHLCGSDTGHMGNVFREEHLRIARDTQWLLDNGFDMPDRNETVIQIEKRKHAGKVKALWKARKDARTDEMFERYLDNRLVAQGTKNTSLAMGRYLRLILEIEKIYGSMDAYQR